MNSRTAHILAVPALALALLVAAPNGQHRGWCRNVKRAAACRPQFVPIDTRFCPEMVGTNLYCIPVTTRTV